MAKDVLEKEGKPEYLINQDIGRIMIFFGIADAIGGYFFGKFSNIFGKRAGMFVIMVVGVSTACLTYYVSYYVFNDNYILGSIWASLVFCRICIRTL